MPVRDMNIGWLEKRVFIPWNQFTGVAQSAAGGGLLRALQSTTSVAVAVASSLVAKLATSAQNDGASTFVMLPYDIDIKKAMRFRVHYLQTATSGTVTWVLTYLLTQAQQAGTAGSTVLAAATAALDTVIPAASGTVVASDHRVTDFGKINRGTIVDTTSDGILFALSCSDSSPVAGLGLLGLEWRYSTRKTLGPERNLLGGRRLVTTRPLGTLLASAQEGL